VLGLARLDLGDLGEVTIATEDRSVDSEENLGGSVGWKSIREPP